MIRTSQTHPLQIAAVSAGPGFGQIGLTFCPGKSQPFAATGAWRRDLQIDLDAIAAWGACAVVTLVEDHELRDLKVEALGEAVRKRHMDWIHAPIPDVSTPDRNFEGHWAEFGEGLRSRLRCGFNVLVHCKGGLGRAGTIAARLLIELGCPPGQAIERVRAARPGAIETAAQEHYGMALGQAAEPQPSTDLEAVRDRALGAMLGLAMGDALGTTLEFRARDTYEPLTDIIGGGPFGLQPGEWTDDTAMAWALADSLIQCGEMNEQDLLARFVSWWRTGAYASNGRCFDIGIATSAALSKWERTKAPHCGSVDPMSAGNGSLMRLAPVAIRYWNDPGRLRDAAARQSKTTHAAAEAVDACVFYAERLAETISGAPRSEVMRTGRGEWSGALGPIIAGSWRGKPRQQVRASGYVAHALEAALWCIGRSVDYRSAVLLAANLGEDADTTAAITGQLAGALAGASQLPSDWTPKIARVGELSSSANTLFDASLN